MWKLGMYNEAKPYLAMILLQVARAGSTVVVKFCLDKGMSSFTFSVYRCLVASILFAPFAIPFERKVRPRMTWSIFIKIMLLGLIEPVIDQNLYYTGLEFTTATFSAAMCNILPAITFVIAWACRLEKVKIRSVHSQVKIMGTLVTVGGAMIMTLITGPVIGLPWTKHQTHHTLSPTRTSTPQEFIKGAIMIVASCVCWAIFYILQAITLKTYPAELSLTTLICMAGAVQGVVATLIFEGRDTSIWTLQFDTALFAIFYAGIINSGVSYYISGVVMREKGPVFATAFNPLTMVAVAIMSSFILSEKLYFGSVMGSVVIVLGLYLLIWGKSKDQYLSARNTDPPPTDPTTTTTTTTDPTTTTTTTTTENSNHEMSNISSRVKPTDEAV